MIFNHTSHQRPTYRTMGSATVPSPCVSPPQSHSSHEAEKRAWRNRCGSLCPFFLQICMWIPFFRQRGRCSMSMTVLMTSKEPRDLSERRKETAVFSSTRINLNILGSRHAKGLQSCGGGGISGQTAADWPWRSSHVSTKINYRQHPIILVNLMTCISPNYPEHDYGVCGGSFCCRSD